MKELEKAFEDIILKSISSEDGSLDIDTCTMQVSSLCSKIAIDFQCMMYNKILGKPESHPVSTKLHESVANQFKKFIQNKY